MLLSTTNRTVSQGISLTLKISKPQEIRFKLNAHNFEINWDDDTIDTSLFHSYTKPGYYNVHISSTELTLLDFSSCQCIHANVSQCNTLQELICQANPLEVLSITECFNLKFLKCQNCRLLKLNVNHLSALRWIDCANNRLKKIDLSGLQQLSILDVSGNNISELLLEKCEYLNYVNIAGNHLGTSALNRIFEQLLSHSENSNVHINFNANPGETSCNIPLLKKKNWKIDRRDVYLEKIADYKGGVSVKGPEWKNIQNSDSTVRLTFRIRQDTSVVIHVAAKNALYIWNPTEITTGEKGQHTFIATQEEEIKEVFIFASELKSLSINNTPCVGVEIKSSTIEALCVSDTEIQTLDLFEFTFLNRLDCSNTEITQLDLRLCRQLNILNCSESKIKKLNITGLNNLQYVDCSGNQLKELNLSGCTWLKTLNIAKNKFSTLDIQQCISLQFLYCQNNNFHNLNALFEQLPKIQFKDVLGVVTFFGNPGQQTADMKLLKEKKWTDKGIQEDE